MEVTMKSSDLIRLRALSALTEIYEDVPVGTSPLEGLVAIDDLLKVVELVIDLHMRIRIESAVGAELHQLFDGDPEPIMADVLSELMERLSPPRF